MNDDFMFVWSSPAIQKRFMSVSILTLSIQWCSEDHHEDLVHDCHLHLSFKWWLRNHRKHDKRWGCCHLMSSVFCSRTLIITHAHQCVNHELDDGKSALPNAAKEWLLFVIENCCNHNQSLLLTVTKVVIVNGRLMVLFFSWLNDPVPGIHRSWSWEKEWISATPAL